MQKSLLVLICFLTSISIAHGRNYEVELVVFQRNVDATTETAATHFSSQNVSKKRKELEKLTKKVRNIQMGEKVFKLSSVRNKLAASGHRILKTARWVQKSAVYQHAPLVSIGNLHGPLSAGFIRVYKTSLIYVDIDLQLTPTQSSQLSSSLDSGISAEQSPVPAVAESSTQLQAPLPINPSPELMPEDSADQTPYYFISEKRRLKFKEVHYFDHPEFGIILGVWPTE